MSDIDLTVTKADLKMDLARQLRALLLHGGDRPGTVYRGYSIPYEHAVACRRALAAEEVVRALLAASERGYPVPIDVVVMARKVMGGR